VGLSGSVGSAVPALLAGFDYAVAAAAALHGTAFLE
jgi:hypothetical protein